MRILTAITLIVGAINLCNPALAQKFPNRPIRIVVPYGPGGASDQIMRAVGEQLSVALGQPVIIDNRGGAGTVIGTDFVARAAPDGYTLGLATFANLVAAPLLSSNVPYNPDQDFEGIGFLATSPMVFVISAELPPKTLPEFVAYAKAHPGTINYGSSGVGSTVQLAAELFSSYAGIRMTHVPYKSSPEVISAIMGGFIQAAMDVVISAKPLIDSGKLRALATTEEKRTALMPEVPTIAESGYPGYFANTWYGLIAPKGTPPAIIERINTQLAQILQNGDLRKRFSLLGMELKSSSPQDLMSFAAAERKKWAEVITKQGLQKN